MSRRNGRATFEQVATITGFIVDSKEVVSWIIQLTPVILSVLTGITLTSQPTAPQIPGFNIKLGSTFQFVLLISATLAYIHILRRIWVKDSREDDPLETTFGNFLIKDLPRFKRPLLLVPLVLILYYWVKIAGFAIENESIENGVFIILSLPFCIGGLMFFALEYSLKESINLEEWEKDTDLKQRWIKRIDQHLRENGFVTTMDFNNSVGLKLTYRKDIAQVNWAILMYFHEFEFEQNLLLSEPYDFDYEDDQYIRTIECYDLSIKYEEA